MADKKGVSHKEQAHRINRIEGQVRGIKKMVEDERYCLDIINQIKAIKSALNSVETNIIEEHINHCVNDMIVSKDEKRAKEVVSEIKGLLKGSSK